jgi:predicted nuclease of predicted toxin-antitoxin system
MKIYLDDDSTNAVLLKLLAREGHDIIIPSQVGNAGQKDPAHFMFAISNGRTLLTHNHEDFECCMNSSCSWAATTPVCLLCGEIMIARAT